MRSDSTGGTMGSDTARSSTSSTGAAQPTTGAATPSGTNTEAMDASGILSQLASANQAEIQEAKDAQSKASNPQVKRFAAKLAHDHQQNYQEAQALAKRLGVTLAAPSGTVSESQSAAMGEMVGKTGAEFDRAFLEHEVQAHQQNIDKIQNTMLPAAKNPRLKAYLQKTATAMKGHLQQAQQLEQRVGGASS